MIEKWNRILEFMKLPEQEGMTLVSTISDYKNQNSRLTLLCADCQENFTISWQNLRAGKKCTLPRCINKRIQMIKGKCKPDKMWQKVLDFFQLAEQKEMILKSTIDDYKNKDTKLTIYCNQCKGDFYMSWERLNLGNICNSKKCLSRRKSNVWKSETSIKIIWDNITEFFQKPEQKEMDLVSTIDDYQNQDSKLTIHCKVCDGNYKMTWQGIRAGKRCNLNECVYKRKSQALRTYTIEIINDRIFEEGEGDLLVSTEYFGYTEPLDIWCHQCGDIYPKCFHGWQRGERCPCRAPNRVWTTEEVRKFMLDDDYHDILETIEYTGTNQILDIKCGKCGETYQTNFHAYKNGGRRCLMCFGKQKRYTQQEIENIINDGNNTCVGKFIKSSIKIDVRCHDCDVIYQKTLFKFKSGERCVVCSHKTRGKQLMLSYMEVKQFIEEAGEKLISQTYTGMKDDIEILCHSCNKIYIRNFHAFKVRGARCNLCKDSRSQGEICVEEHLENLQLDFKCQQRFNECRNPLTNYMLPFDFFISKPRCLLEFHGQQHYKWTPGWHQTEKEFNEQQTRDKVKEKFAEDAHIPLLIIPYWELLKQNVPTIINEFLAKVKADEAACEIQLEPKLYELSAEDINSMQNILEATDHISSPDIMSYVKIIIQDKTIKLQEPEKLIRPILKIIKKPIIVAQGISDTDKNILSS